MSSSSQLTTQETLFPQRFAFNSPDVTWNKGDRASTIREAKPSDARWFSHRQGFARAKANEITTNPELKAVLEKLQASGGYDSKAYRP